MPEPIKLVLLRHGQSTWNLENRFTGWTDVGLTPAGEDEATEAGRLMLEAELAFDVAHTSVQQRAISTLYLALKEMGLLRVPVQKHWRLNERHYGALQGLNKSETAQLHGPEQVHAWRRSYDTPPPGLGRDDPRHPSHDPTYAWMPADLVPGTECLKDVVERMLPYWHDAIVGDLHAGKRVLIAAHGNSLRALVKHLDAIPDSEIPDLNIPTGIPLVYELDDGLSAMRHYYLGDAESAAAAAKAVADQAR